MASDYHVLPVNDLREHAEARDCWCEPRVEPVKVCRAIIGHVVVHQSADGRELIEQHGIQ